MKTSRLSVCMINKSHLDDRNLLNLGLQMVLLAEDWRLDWRLPKIFHTSTMMIETALQRI